MAHGQTSNLIGHLRQIALRADLECASDGHLLECFVVQNDKAAFDAILRRYGPMVFGVCQRIAANEQDAEDAFQATFLVLLRKAESVRPREQIGNWLYGVAHRTALRVKGANALRASRERPLGDCPIPDAAPLCTDPEPIEILQKELLRMPDKFRLPILLCDIQGRTQRDVARSLELPVSTLTNRLRKARRMLSRRLVRRGVTLSGAAVSTVLTLNSLQAAVPVSLADGTRNLVRADGSVSTDAASKQVQFLAEGVLQAMRTTRLKSLALTAALIVSVIGVFSFARQPVINSLWASALHRAIEPAPDQPGANSGPQKKSKTGRIYFYFNPQLGGALTSVAPDGKDTKHLAPFAKKDQFALMGTVRLAPDKRRLAFGKAASLREFRNSPDKIYVADVSKKKEAELVIDMPGARFSNWVWSPDSKELALSSRQANATQNWIVNVKTKKVREINLPQVTSPDGKKLNIGIVDWSPDGAWFLALDDDGILHLVKTNGAATRKLTKSKKNIHHQKCRFSPNGRKVLFITFPGGPKDSGSALWVTDVKTGKTKAVVAAKNFAIKDACWSPNGDRIAYSVMLLDEKGKLTGETNLNVMNIDGTKSETIVQGQGRVLGGESQITIMLRDWR